MKPILFRQRRISLWLILIGTAWCLLSAQSTDVSITLKGTYTTSTRFLHNVDKVEVYDEGKVLESNFGYGADVRWNMLWDRFYLGVSIEKINGHETFERFYPQFNYLRVPVEEGFKLTAIELSGFYIVPISSENIQFYLGGGFGLYDGDRIYSIAKINAGTVRSTSNIGIHVLTGIDYKFMTNFAVRGELKFRDPNFNVTSKFDQPYVIISDYRIPLEQNETTTSVNLFGVNYMIGLVFQP